MKRKHTAYKKNLKKMLGKIELVVTQVSRIIRDTN